jgi:hypothetical protein
MDADRLNVPAHASVGMPTDCRPVPYRGCIIGVAENGLGYAIEAGDAIKVRSVNPPLDHDGLFLATPALAGPNLLIRGSRKLHCLREE